MKPKRKKCKKVLGTLKRFGFLVLWILINSSAFYYTYSQYKGKPEYYYIRSILGVGLCISRGSATVLNINCCLILLPICRAFNSFVCTIVNRLFSKNVLLFWIQNAKSYHIVIAITSLIASGIHTIAHIQNAINFSKNYDENHVAINWASYKDENPLLMIMESLTGLTGFFMLIVILILALSSCKIVRRTHYNLFWYTHNISYIFLLMFVVHPISGILKEQINVISHKPGCVLTNITKTNESVACLEEAKFAPVKSQGWLWIILPVSIYLLDYVFRTIRRNNGISHIVNADHFQDGVVLTISSPNSRFATKPGQFVLLHCPTISRLEWHPFTIIKCPTASQPNFQILVRARGDWSTKLNSLKITCDNRLYKWPPEKPVGLYVDGPYSSPMEEIIKCKIVIGIASGVGITPFIASIRHLIINDTKVPNKIYLIWIIRNIFQIEWSSDLLLRFHNKCWNKNQPDRFSFDVYVTTHQGIYRFVNDYKNKSRLLLNRLHFGKPDWNALFRQWRSFHPSDGCNVFACGPKSLRKQMQKNCEKFSNFHFVKESFP